MTKLVTVNRDKTRLLPPNAFEKGWRIYEDEAIELGLIESESKPQERRPAFDATKAKTAPQQRRTPKKG